MWWRWLHTHTHTHIKCIMDDCSCIKIIVSMITVVTCGVQWHFTEQRRQRNCICTFCIFLLFFFYFCLSVSLLKLHLNRTFTPMIQFAHCLGSYNPYSPRLHCTHRMKRKKIYWKSITVAFTKVYLTSIIITLPLLLQFLYSFSSCFFFFHRTLILSLAFCFHLFWYWYNQQVFA